jgi:hypothetical protein
MLVVSKIAFSFQPSAVSKTSRFVTPQALTKLDADVSLPKGAIAPRSWVTNRTAKLIAES